MSLSNKHVEASREAVEAFTSAESAKAKAIAVKGLANIHRVSNMVDVKQGWGIGLPYVRTVAESHVGSVAVESSGERGATFMIDVHVDVRPYQPSPGLG